MKSQTLQLQLQTCETAECGGAPTKSSSSSFSSSSSTDPFTITRTTTRTRNSRGLRRFGQILLECNSALRVLRSKGWEIFGLGVMRFGNSEIDVPDGHMKIAQRFNAGMHATPGQVPKGRLNVGTVGCQFSRPFGTRILSNTIPALKRRAITGMSLRDKLSSSFRTASGTVARRRANPPRSAAWLCAPLVLLLATGLVGRAQSTNAVARPDYQSFKIITDRNIFDPNRSSGSPRRTEGTRPARVESFALVGTMSYENGTYAFFDGTGSSYRKATKTGDTIAGYKVADISPDRVKLETNGQQIELSVGVQMRKQDEGVWQLAGRAESFGTSSPATAATEKTESGSGGEESDVLKKLMQKREQELK